MKSSEEESLNRIINGLTQGVQGNPGVLSPITNSNPPLLNEKDFRALVSKYGNFYANRNKGGQNKRSELGKELFKLSINAMNKLGNLTPQYGRKFQGLKYETPKALEGMSGTAAGLFMPQDNTIRISPSIPSGMDIVPVINHETQHAIEHHYPKVVDTTYSFLKKRFSNQEDGSYVPKEYVPKLYRGMQDIINFPLFTNNYNAYETQANEKQGVPYKESVLNKIQHEGSSLETRNKYQLAHRFDEVPAFMVQVMTENDNHPWKIDEGERDAVKLLHNISTDIRDQYSNLGLNDKNDENDKYPTVKKTFDDLIKKLETRLARSNSPQHGLELSQLQPGSLNAKPSGDLYREKYLKNYFKDRGPWFDRQLKASHGYEMSDAEKKSLDRKNKYNRDNHVEISDSESNFPDNGSRAAYSPPRSQLGRPKVYGGSLMRSEEMQRGGNSSRALLPQGNTIGQNRFGARGEANLGKRLPRSPLGPNFLGYSSPTKTRLFSGANSNRPQPGNPMLLQDQGRQGWGTNISRGFGRDVSPQQAKPSLIQLIQNKQLARRIRGNSDANLW